MAGEIFMAKVQGLNQAAQLQGMAGKSFVVGNMATAGNGMNSWITLTPTGGTEAIAVKLESARQVSDLSALVGKTVTVGKSPAVAAGAGKWLVMQPVAAGAAAKGAAAGSGMAGVSMLKLEGATQASKAASLTGKTFTVTKPAMIGGKGGMNWLFLKPTSAASGKGLVALKLKNGMAATSMIGKTVTIGKAPIVAGNAGNWLVMQTVAGSAAAKAGAGAVAATGAAKSLNAAATVGKGACAKTMTVAGTVAGSTTATAGATAAKTAAAATGTIWTGTGMSLGLGLGLGAAGPLLLGGALAAAGYGVYKYRKGNVKTDTDLEDAIADA
ncbi:MAG: hypothetical protein HQL36_08470 [Alphaproteobacteria bacterium]|nr:hypothetical protein [Alphaproteobacteria bacterium]MBF0251698.1 hypothetical protein [Alphaproteobacteria bacterium]